MVIVKRNKSSELLGEGVPLYLLTDSETYSCLARKFSQNSKHLILSSSLSFPLFFHVVVHE